MKNKLKEILEKLSIFTTDPDKDWRRMFLSFVSLILISFTWSVFFYIRTKQEIADSESLRGSSLNSVAGEREDELRNLIMKFEAKKMENDAVVSGVRDSSVLELGDPSR
ncbi:MAG: hypothetical protein K9M11_04610 [Candidatus Pacebacteria bacterium]|nr:hypothetical protein [Candidatus Paceibacterota bacterium]